MVQWAMRPRFQLSHDAPLDETYKCVLTKVETDEDSCCVGVYRKPHMELRVRPEQRHYWSPHLTLEFSDVDDGTKIHALVGPAAHVWTMFLALYGVIGLSAFATAIYGLSQWSIKETPTGLYWLPLFAVAALLVYAASGFGKRWARPQTQQLCIFLQQALTEAAPTDTPLDDNTASSPADEPSS